MPTFRIKQVTPSNFDVRQGRQAVGRIWAPPSAPSEWRGRLTWRGEEHRAQGLTVMGCLEELVRQVSAANAARAGYASAREMVEAQNAEVDREAAALRQQGLRVRVRRTRVVV